MSYVRPPLPPEQRYIGADGTRFQYGDRYDVDRMPPAEAYSRATDPERFAPLHDVADALVTWAVAAFDVTVDDDVAAVAENLALGQRPLVRKLRLTPSDPAAAPLAMLWTGFPGICVAAGTMFSLLIPQCGCDACDEGVLDGVESLEYAVQAVIGGGLTEWLTRACRPPSLFGRRSGKGPGYWLQGPDGCGRGQAGGAVPWTGMPMARRMLAGLPGGHWQPWPRRTPS